MGAPRFWVPGAFGGPALLGAPGFCGARAFGGLSIFGAYRFVERKCRTKNYATSKRAAPRKREARGICRFCHGVNPALEQSVGLSGLCQSDVTE